ncbi:MAG: CAP domain-containing protein [Chloroflexota bacterium]
MPLLLAGLMLIPFAPPAAASITSAQIDSAESRVVTLINAERTVRGLRPLYPYSKLMMIAAMRSGYMARTGWFSHTEKSGRTVFGYLRTYGIRWVAAGEVIAWNTYYSLYDSARTVVRQWMGSSVHRAILLGNYRLIGIGLGVAGSKRYWTGVFVRQ